MQYISYYSHLYKAGGFILVYVTTAIEVLIEIQKNFCCHISKYFPVLSSEQPETEVGIRR